MARLDEQDFDEKRLSRRQKRKKGELIAYIILVVTLLFFAAIIALGVHFIKGALTDKPAEQVENELAEGEETEAEKTVIETPQESEEVVEYSEEQILTEIIDKVIGEMSLEDKVAGLFIITPEQLTGVDTAVKAGSGTQEALSQYAVGGIIYAPKNIKSTDQIKEMLDTTQSMSKYPIFTILSDQAASSDAAKSTLFPELQQELSDKESFKAAGKYVGEQLFKYGFNFDMAPFIDFSEESVFGQEPEDVKENASAFAEGLKESGITSCGLVFPIKGDTASQMVSIDLTKDDLVVKEYESFKGIIDTGASGAIMVSNASFPEITGDSAPASLSNFMIEEELKGTLGFDGIIITSPLNEGAITEYYTSAEAAVNALKAGADMICMPENFEESYQGVFAAVNGGSISEDRINESLKKIYRIKYSDKVNQISQGN